MTKQMRDRAPLDPVNVNFAHIDDFAGTNHLNITTDLHSIETPSTWIIDTGANNHICGNLNLFSEYTMPNHKPRVHLPDGSVKEVQHIGSITLHRNITLTDVMHVPSFRRNLLSVHKLCSLARVQF